MGVPAGHSPEALPRPVLNENAAADAVRSGVTSSAAQSIGGSVATVAATPVGAVGTTLAHNGGFSALGNLATDSPEVPGLAWIVTFLYQGIKHHPKIDQNRMQWFLLPALGFLVGVIVFLLVSDGQWGRAVAKGIQNCGIIAANAATNYRTIQPLGILGPAADMT